MGGKFYPPPLEKSYFRNVWRNILCYTSKVFQMMRIQRKNWRLHHYDVIYSLLRHHCSQNSTKWPPNFNDPKKFLFLTKTHPMTMFFMKTSENLQNTKFLGHSNQFRESNHTFYKNGHPNLTIICHTQFFRPLYKTFWGTYMSKNCFKMCQTKFCSHKNWHSFFSRRGVVKFTPPHEE